MLRRLLQHYLFSPRAGALIKSISWLCFCGVAISVFAMILVLTIMNGFNTTIYKRILSAEPHFVVFDSLQKIETYRFIEDGDKLVENDAFLTFEQDVILRTVDGVFGGAKAIGLNPEDLKNKMRDVYSNKQMLDKYQPKDFDLKDNEIVIGNVLASNLNLFLEEDLVLVSPESLLLPPGEKAAYQKVRVKKIVSTHVDQIDSQVIYYNKNTGLKSLGRTASFSRNFEIKVKDDKAYKLTASLLKKEEKVENWKERNSSLLYALKMEKIAMGSFLGLTVIIACLSILVVMSLLIAQKRKDIALLMTIGLTRKKVELLFTHLGFSISTLGAFFGYILAYVVQLILDNFKLDLFPGDFYYDTSVPVSWNAGLSFAIFAIAVLVSYVGAKIPARFAAKQGLVEQLGRCRG